MPLFFIVQNRKLLLEKKIHNISAKRKLESQSPIYFSDRQKGIKMRKLMMIALMTLTLVSATSMPAFAGMNNAVSEDFFDDLPEIEEEVPEESEEDSKEQDETEAQAEETKEEKSEESEPETKAEVTESHEETKATEAEIVPERTISVREDVDNTPERPTRVIYARRNVVICDNEPIESVPETTAEETEESISETVEEEIETIPETLDHKVPEKSSSSSLPKTADFSDLMIAGVAVLAVVAAAFAVVANRKKNHVSKLQN